MVLAEHELAGEPPDIFKSYYLPSDGCFNASVSLHLCERSNCVQDEDAIALYEEHVRFMVLAEHELAGEPPDVFDSHLNLEQINKVHTVDASRSRCIMLERSSRSTRTSQHIIRGLAHCHCCCKSVIRAAACSHHERLLFSTHDQAVLSAAKVITLDMCRA